MAKIKKDRLLLTQGGEEIDIDYDNLRSAVLVLRSINHELRKRIINLLERYDQLTVTEIYIKLRIEQSVASQHLAILRKAGIVTSVRSGKFIYYGLDRERLAKVTKLIAGLAVNRKIED